MPFYPVVQITDMSKRAFMKCVARLFIHILTGKVEEVLSVIVCANNMLIHVPLHFATMRSMVKLNLLTQSFDFHPA